ncbi:MAG: epoxyqueuosine reductase QueH [Thermoleophilia bacterium]
MTRSLLLHICCGPCSSASIPALRAVEREVVGFFFNPNIHPFLEFRERLRGTRKAAAMTGLELREDLSYDPASWFADIQSADGLRCFHCIGMRLDRTAREAADRGYTAFSTTLAISPWQDHEAIRAGGRAAAACHGVEFVYEDLRPLYPESRRLSREWDLYRQKYCGCLLSEWERYRER